MQKKKVFYVLWAVVFVSVFLSGCNFFREKLLEDEEVLVITGQISDTEEMTEPMDDTKETDSDTIYVYICGQVQHPGVYQISPQERVFSVIQLAGGLTENADAYSVNQAQTLMDGQMIYIPAQGEEIVPKETSVSGGSLGQTHGEGIVNINTADLAALMSLPGIGEGKAQSILKYRQEHGSFSSIEEIMNVEGIKEGTFSKFKDQIAI